MGIKKKIQYSGCKFTLTTDNKSLSSILHPGKKYTIMLPTIVVFCLVSNMMLLIETQSWQCRLYFKISLEWTNDDKINKDSFI